MSIVFQIITKFIDTLGIMFPTISKYLKIWLGWINSKTSLSGISKAISFIVMINGLVTSLALYIITQGGLWPFFVMFFTNILFPIIMPARIPVDIVKKEVWRSGWERIFSYFQKLLMAIGVFLFATGVMGFITWIILFIITELPNLVIKCLRFLIIELFPLILETIMKLIMDDKIVPKAISGPITMIIGAIESMASGIGIMSAAAKAAEKTAEKAGEMGEDVVDGVEQGWNGLTSLFGG